MQVEVPKSMFTDDTLIAMQSDPRVVAQLMSWQMLKLTAEWPPESMAHMVQMADKLDYVTNKLIPSIAVYEFTEVEDGEEEEEEGFD